MFTKENFKEIYEKEIEELSLVESAIDKLEFQMNGKSDVHENVLSAFERYADIHSFVNDENSDKLYYGYVANKVVENWEAFHNVCFELWNFSKMSKGSLEKFYVYIYSAFEMVEEGTFKFEDYIDEQFQTYMVNLGKFFPKNICDEIWKTFIDYLKDNDEWNEEFFKC